MKLLINEKRCYPVTLVLPMRAFAGLKGNKVTVSNSNLYFYIDMCTYVCIYIYIRFSIIVFGPSVTCFLLPAGAKSKPVYNP